MLGCSVFRFGVASASSSMAVQRYLALQRVVEALQEGHHGGLAAAREAHQGREPAGLQLQLQPLQRHNVGPGGVPEAHPLEADLQGAPSTEPHTYITQPL